MRMHADDLLAFLAFLAILATIAYYLYLRHKRVVLRHNERLAALEKGVALPDLEEPSKAAPWTPRVYLLRGMLWLFSGLALSLMIASISLTSQHERSMSSRLWEANQLRKFGATEPQLEAYWRTPQPDGMPLGVASLGLVPMGVGLAYLVFYRKEQEQPR